MHVGRHKKGRTGPQNRMRVLCPPNGIEIIPGTCPCGRGWSELVHRGVHCKARHTGHEWPIRTPPGHTHAHTHTHTHHVIPWS